MTVIMAMIMRMMVVAMITVTINANKESLSFRTDVKSGLEYVL